MSMLATAMKRLRRRIALSLMLRNALAFTAAWLFLWGTVAVALRVGRLAEPSMLLWGSAGVPFVLFFAVRAALRQVPAPAICCALLDQTGHCGGLLMAAQERPLGSWTLPALPDLQLRWQSRRLWIVFPAAALFVSLSLLYPQSALFPASSRPLDVSREAKTLARQIEVLEEETILDAERAKSLKEKLEKIERDALGTNPVKTLEALDHLQNLVAQEAQKAAEKIAPRTERLTKAKALADVLRKQAELDPKVQADALRELARLTEKAAEEDKLLKDKLDPDALNSLDKGDYSSEKLGELGKDLADARKDLLDRLEKLADARLIDPEALRKALEGEIDADELARLLEEADGEDGDRIADLLMRCRRPGRGGVTRGGGPTPITFGKESPDAGAKFKEQVLPPGQIADLKKNKLVGVGRQAPTVEKSAKTAGGAIDQAAAGGGSAETQVVLPRHRGAVDRYFERTKRGNESP